MLFQVKNYSQVLFTQKLLFIYKKTDIGPKKYCFLDFFV
jgi:hypothetical protein